MKRIGFAQYNVLYPNSTLPNEENSYEYAHGPCSNQLNCFLPYGICINSTICMCMPDYANIYIKGESLHRMSCSYKKKKVVVAGLLELFLPFGLGHFYVGHYTLGGIKFFYNIIIYTFCCFAFCKGTNNEQFVGLIAVCIILSCIMPIWNIVDLFLFFTGTYKDGYGVSLA